MNECPHRESLIALGEALGWKPVSGLRHVLACSTCLGELTAMEGLRTVLAEEAIPTSGFTDRVVAAVAVAPAALPAPTARPRSAVVGRSLLALGTGVLAAGGVLFAALFASSGSGVGPPALPLIAVSVAAGLWVGGRALWRGPWVPDRPAV